MVAAALQYGSVHAHFEDIDTGDMAEPILEPMVVDSGEDARIEIVGAPGPEIEEVYNAMQNVAKRLAEEYGILATITVAFTEWQQGPIIGYTGPRVYINGELLDSASLTRDEIEERTIDMVLALLGEEKKVGKTPDGLSLINPHNGRGLATAAL